MIVVTLFFSQWSIFSEILGLIFRLMFFTSLKKIQEHQMAHELNSTLSIA